MALKLFCDCCGKEIVKAPEWVFLPKGKKLDLCSVCFDKFSNFIEDLKCQEQLS